MDFRKYFPKYKKKTEKEQKSVATFLQRYRSYFQRNSIYLDNVYNKIGVDIGAGLNFKHIKIVKQSGKSDIWTDYEATESDLMSVLTYSPNPIETPTVFWSNVAHKIIEESLAVVIPTYQPSGQIDSLILADRVESISGSTITLRLDSDSTSLDLDLGSVWMFENPKKNLSTQLNQLTRLIDLNLSAISEKLSESGQSMRAVIKYNTMMEDAALKKKVDDRVENLMDVAKHGGVGYLDSQEDFQELKNSYNTATSEEVEFLKSQLYNAFGLNEALFTGNYTEMQYRAYYQSVLMPIVRVIKEEITRKYFTKTARTQGQKLIVQTDLISIASLKDLTDFISKGGYVAAINANEMRGFIGMAPYEGGDIYQSNRNAVTMAKVNAEAEQTNQNNGAQND